MVGSVLRVRYELTQLLYEGPIFIAYAARDRLQGTEVCVRLVRAPFAAEAEFVSKLLAVVRMFSIVQHPGVEAMIEVDDDEGTPFLITELTKGLPLAERIRKLAPFSVPVAVSTAISLCEGLEALHSMGLAHGDVSAVNVASMPDGQVRLQLPGMWQVYAANPMAAGIALPSMSPYLSPEVSAGAMPSPASDVYAAGVLLYELLTGRLPYNADTPVSMALKHATGTVPTVRMYNPSVPAVLDEIVKKALAKDPAARYATGGALLSDLRVLQDALRFGRTVTWPITPETTPPQISMPKTTAARPEAAPKTRVKVERDVPLVMWFLIAVFGTSFAVLVGVVMFFNLSKPPIVKVPNMVKSTVAEARIAAQQAKLKIDEAGEKSSDKIPEGQIISTDPEPGQPVREGSHVRVIVSSGSQLVVVPNVKSKSLDEAREMIEKANLQLDDNIEIQRSSKVESGLVLKQSPPGGSKVDPTTKIKIIVSSGDSGDNPNGDEPPKAPAGQTNIYTLRVKMAGIPSPVELRIDIVDDQGTRTVFGPQDEDPDETVELATRGVGKQVTFRIYYNGELKKEVTQVAEQGSPAPANDGDNNGQ